MRRAGVVRDFDALSVLSVSSVVISVAGQSPRCASVVNGMFVAPSGVAHEHEK